MRRSRWISAFSLAGSRVGAVSESQFVHLATIALARGRPPRGPAAAWPATTRGCDEEHRQPFLHVAAHAPQPCTNTGACQAECPKSISVAHIARLNREFLSAKFED